MPRASATQRVSNFQNGWVTEATGLTYPENSLRDVQNCDIDVKGSIRRRLGLQRENGGESANVEFSPFFDSDKFGFFSDIVDSGGGFSKLLQDIKVDAKDVAVTVHGWSAVNNVGDFNLLIVQVGARLLLFDWDDEAIVSNLLDKGIRTSDDTTNARAIIDLEKYVFEGSGINGKGKAREAMGYRAHAADMAMCKLASASGFGRLWMVGDCYYPFYLEFQPNGNNPRTGTVVAKMVGQDGERGIGQLTIRDFNGIPDVVTVSENLTLSGLNARKVSINGIGMDGTGAARHQYNLLNQGWPRHNIIRYKRVRDGKLPSNTMVWFVGRDGNNINADEIIFTDWGDTPAPKGRIKLDALAGGFGSYESATPEPVDGESGFSLYVWGDSRSVDNNALNKGEGFAVAHDLRKAVNIIIDDLGLSTTKQVTIDQWEDGINGVAALTEFSGQGQYFDISMFGQFDVSDGLYAFPSDRPQNGYTAAGENEVAQRAFTTATFFAGRLWLSGDDNPGRPGGIYFSRVITKPIHASEFQQTNDPTSEDFSELLADDGGVIYIPEAGKIVKLQPFGTGVLVLGTNGVWYISGGQENFAADSFSVDKLASTKAVGRDNVVSAVDAVTFWAEDGIYTVTFGQAPLPTVTEISEGRIASFFGNVPLRARQNAWGTYDPRSRKVYWNYRSTSKDTDTPTELQSFYDSVLVLDVRTGAFYRYSHELDENLVRGIGPSFPRRTRIVPLSRGNVVADGEDVTVGGELVTVFTEEDGALVDADDFLVGIKHIFCDSLLNTFSFVEYSSLLFHDFVDTTFALDPVPYTSFLITGDETVESPEQFKQATWLHSFFEKTETGVEIVDDQLQFIRPSGCKVQAQWDWHRTGSGNRWSNPQTAYRLRRPFSPSSLSDTVDTGEGVIYTRLKIRGKGRALNLRYESEPGKDFKLLGYSVPFTAGTT